MNYFKQISDGKIVSVESKSVNLASPDFIEATKAEHKTFLKSLPPIPPSFSPLQIKYDKAITDKERLEVLAEALGIKV